MKNSADNTVKRPKFGVLDAIIVLLVIIAVVGIYFRYNIVNILSGTQNFDNYTVTFTIDNIRYTTPNFIDVGDEVYFASDKDHFGTLISVSENMGALSITPASEYFTSSNGEIVEIFYPNSETRISATGRLNCIGRYTEEGGLLVNGSTHIAAGQYVDVTTEYVTVTLRISEIKLATDTAAN